MVLYCIWLIAMFSLLLMPIVAEVFFQPLLMESIASAFQKSSMKKNDFFPSE